MEDNTIEEWLDVTNRFIDICFDDEHIILYYHLLDLASTFPHLNPENYQNYMNERGFIVYAQVCKTLGLVNDCIALHLLIYLMNNESTLLLEYDDVIHEVKKINRVK